MKNYCTSLFKTCSLVILCALFFIVSNAQRRQNQDERRQRTPSPGWNSRPDRQPSQNNNRGQRWSQGQPNRDYQTPNHVRTPLRREAAQRPSPHFYHPDRNFRNDHVRVDRRPRYEYYNNSFRHYDRRPVYNAHNPGWRYSYCPPRRTVVTSFPFAYQTINYGGCGYRFYDGTFYRPYNSSFIVVAPPIGIFINTLPFGYRRIYVRDNPYYYFNGTYYDDYENNYRVVAPPVGAVVESIPQGYESMTIDGETYYKVDGVQYKPEVQDNGEVWYEVIKVD